MEEGAMSQGVQPPPRCCKGNGMEPPLEPPEGTQPCPPRISAPCN